MSLDARESVALVWIYLLPEEDVVLGEGGGEGPGVLDVHVVVVSAVHQQQLVTRNVAELRLPDQTGPGVSLPVVVDLRAAHQSLGVGGVVLPPVRHGGHGDGAGEEPRPVPAEEEAGQVAPVAPAPDTDLLSVHVV